jgi:hypothetical protein
MNGKCWLKLLISGSVVAVLSACGGAQTKSQSTAGSAPSQDFSQYGKLLSGEEIKSTMSGVKISGKDAYKFMGKYWEWIADYSADGTIQSKADAFNDTGTWAVESNMLCIHFKYFHNGQKFCNQVRNKDGVYKMINNGEKLENSFTILKKS